MLYAEQFDDIITVCESFYMIEEVDITRVLRTKITPSKRLAKHKGSDTEKVKKMLMAFPHWLWQ